VLSPSPMTGTLQILWSDFQAGALLSNCPEGAPFSQRSLRKSVDRYSGRSGDFVRVWLFVTPL
jgi:hypothetical protein